MLHIVVVDQGDERVQALAGQLVLDGDLGGVDGVPEGTELGGDVGESDAAVDGEDLGVAADVGELVIGGARLDFASVTAE